MTYGNAHHDGERASDAQSSARLGSLAFTRVVACVGSGEFAGKVILHACTVAKALGVSLLLLRVCEAKPADDQCFDPVEWELRRREADARVEALVEQFRPLYRQIEAEVVEGQAAEQISLWVRAHPCDLPVLGIHGEWRPIGWGLGDTAREVIERAPGSLLLVPCSAADVSQEYRRLLVPMDGSCSAESVLPFAMWLAKTQHAELLLVHVVPPSILTEVTPPESGDLELCERLTRRNERVARHYLQQWQARASENGIVTRTQVLRDDVRSSLARLASDEGVDMVVLSAQGCSSRLDVPYGSVTSFLITHARKPLLIMRARPVLAVQERDEGDKNGSRLPLRGI